MVKLLFCWASSLNSKVTSLFGDAILMLISYQYLYFRIQVNNYNLSASLIYFCLLVDGKTNASKSCLKGLYGFHYQKYQLKETLSLGSKDHGFSVKESENKTYKIQKESQSLHICRKSDSK